MLHYSQGGIAQYTLHLIRALADIDSEDRFTILKSRKERRTFVQQPNFHYRSLWTPSHHHLEQLTLPFELAFQPLDVLHSTDFIPPFRRNCRVVITVHDLAFLHYPYLLTKDSARYYGQIKRAAESAEGIIAVSENTRRDMLQLLGIPLERVDVIYHAADPIFQPLDDLGRLEVFCREHDLPSSFMLWVGVLEPRKNLPILLRAFSILRDEGELASDHLVVVGPKGWLFQDALDLINELRLKDRIIFYGPATLSELMLLYNCAWLFVFPSLYEGFGFPPLEAMACGTPVVCSNAASLPEVVGDAAVLFDPHDSDTLAHAIAEVKNNAPLRQELRQKGLQRAAQFSWRKTAEQTLAIYRRVHRQ